jgi:hypothetical protein
MKQATKRYRSTSPTIWKRNSQAEEINLNNQLPSLSSTQRKQITSIIRNDKIPITLRDYCKKLLQAGDSAYHDKDYQLEAISHAELIEFLQKYEYRNQIGYDLMHYKADYDASDWNNYFRHNGFALMSLSRRKNLIPKLPNNLQEFIDYVPISVIFKIKNDKYLEYMEKYYNQILNEPTYVKVLNSVDIKDKICKTLGEGLLELQLKNVIPNEKPNLTNQPINTNKNIQTFDNNIFKILNDLFLFGIIVWMIFSNTITFVYSFF